MDEAGITPEHRQIAEAVREACLTSALEGYEEASMRGVCHEGAWECALGAIRTLDLQMVLAQLVREQRQD
jgi:hypothetical protein